MRRSVYIASQARDPRGFIGKLIAAIMAKETIGVNERAVGALDIQPSDHVLDIGCGSGLSLKLIAELAQKGKACGVDPSLVMAERAVQMNRSAVKAGRVDVRVATMAQLPFPDQYFDKVMSVHTLYFVEDLNAAFSEVARVLKPEGLLVLAFRTPANETVVSNFPPEVYTFRSLQEILRALKGSGFSVFEVTEEFIPEPCVVLARVAVR